MHARGRGGVSATFAARLGLLPPPAGAQRPAERPADAPVEVPAEPAPRPPKPSSARDVYVLWTHDERFSKEAGRNGTRQPRLALISQHLWNLQDVLINPQVFPGIRANDVVEIFLARPSLLPSASHSRSHSLMGEALFAIPEEVKALEPLATPKRLVLQATLVDKDVLSKQPQLQISLDRSIAASFDIPSRSDVVVRKIDPLNVAVDYVEVLFKDQYVGRADMWRLKMATINTCVWIGKKISYAGVIRARVKGLFANGSPVTSGYVLGTTKMIFRSESAKFFIFLQLSRDMFEFAEDSELMIEKAIQGFLPELFAKWKDCGANHVVTIVLFTRFFYPNDFDHSDDPAVSRDLCTGKLKKDFYQVVADFESRTDWNTVLPMVKKAIQSFSSEILLTRGKEAGVQFAGTNSLSEDGCILEAVNLALNSFDRHYVDRDLLRTGLSIVVVTPGSGTYRVDEKLFRLTSQRMVDNGIGLDLVCLSPPPLYTAPLFRFNGANDSRRGSLLPEGMRLEDMEDLDGLESDAAVVPHWIDLSFWHRSGQSDMVFHPRGRMENADLLYMRQSMADDIILKDCDPIDSTSLAGLDTAGHDARVFAMFGEERGPEPVQIVVENVPIEDETGRFGYDGSPEKHHDSNAGVAPISIRARDRPFSSLASSLDNTLSRSTPGIGTLNTRFRRNSPGKYGLPGRSLGASGLGDQLHGLNPFHPAKNLLRMTAHIRRWLHIFPKLEQYSEDDPSIKWFSLSTPACLPLTTDFFPTARQLAERYHEYSYILSPFVDESSIFVDYGSKDMRSLDVLLMELVYHRLAQGFQIIVFASAQEAHVQKGPSVPGAASGSFGKSFMAREVERKPFATGDTGMWTHSSLGKHVYLSLGDHVHHLAFDSLAQNIEVKRYVLKGSRASSTASYQFAIWPNEGPHFRSVSVQFEDSRLISYNWNYLDHLIAGYQDEMTDALRFWRTRFLLIPADNPPLQASLMLPTNETLDEEELRLAGFSKFLEVFEKSRWIPPAERRNADPKTGRVSGIQINLTTFTAAGYVIHEWLKGPMEDAGSSRNLRPLHSGGIGQPGGSPEVGTPRDQSLSRQSSLATIAVAMQLPGAVPFRDRRWHFRLYETTFLGSECVDWMVQAFPDIDSREAAVAFGDELLDRGLFVHVNQKHRFLDGYYYYRLKDEFAPAKSLISKGLRWLAGAKSTSSAEVMADKLKPGESIEAKNHELQGNSTTDLGAPRRPVEMSRSLIVDMDPQKRSNRRELAIVHYDTVHNPKACYHFQLHWLSCTARLMEDMLLSWARMADKCGLRMIEAPVEQIQEFSPDNPFRMVSFLQLSVQPPVREEVKARLMLDVDVPLLWFEMEFLRSLGFIIDVEADSRFPAGSTQYSYTRPAHMYTQMVHRTGLAFIQLLGPTKGFLWANNRFLTSNSSSVVASRGATSAMSADQLLGSVRKACADADGLEKFWDDCQAKLKSLPAELLEDSITSAAEVRQPAG